MVGVKNGPSVLVHGNFYAHFFLQLHTRAALLSTSWNRIKAARKSFGASGPNTGAKGFHLRKHEESNMKSIAVAVCNRHTHTTNQVNPVIL